MSDKPKKSEKKHLHYGFSLRVGTDEVIKDKDVDVRLSESGDPVGLCSQGSGSGSVFSVLRRGGPKPKYVAEIKLDTSQTPAAIDVKLKKNRKKIAERTFRLFTKPDGDRSKWVVTLKPVENSGNHFVQVVYRLGSGDPQDCAGGRASSITLASNQKEGDDEPKGANTKP